MRKRFFIQFDKLPGTPKHHLHGETVIGGQEGDIILRGNNGVAPRHCCLKVDEEVVSLIDFGSEVGTLVNDIRVHPGKVFLLKETDIIKAGDIFISVHSEEELKGLLPEQSPSEEQLEENEETEDGFQDEEADNSTEQEQQSEEDEQPSAQSASQEDEQESSEQESPSEDEQIEQLLDKDDLKEAAFSASHLPEEAPSTSFRKGGTWATFKAIAVFSDILLSIISDILFSPYQQYRNFISNFDRLIEDLVIPHVQSPALLKSSFELGTAYLKYLFLYFCIRLIGRIILGVTPGQYIIGMRNFKPFISSRVLSIPRSFLEPITAPFLIFDLPCLFSMRTFKEVITGARIEVKSKLHFLFGFAIIFPMLILATFVSPLFKGFQERAEIKVLNYDLGLDNPDGELIGFQSQYFKFNFEASENMVFYPDYRLLQNKNKKKLIVPLKIYDNKFDASATFSLHKKFSLKKLLQMAGEMNPLFNYYYPTLRSYLSDISHSNKNFRNSSWTALKKKQFIEEYKELIEDSFELSTENFVEHIKEKGPFLKGHIDLRDSFSYILDEDKISEVQFLSIGEVEFVRFVKDNPSKSLKHFLIPLGISNGVVYKFEFQTRNYVKNFYEGFLLELSQISENEILTDRERNLFWSMDLIMQNKVGINNFEIMGPIIFKTFYERASRIIKKGNHKELAFLSSSLGAHIQVFEILKRKLSSTQEGFGQKLMVNLKDLQSAVESKNKAFFEVEN